MFAGPFAETNVARAVKAGIGENEIHNLRDWTSDRNRTVDDRPFGGGAGMLVGGKMANLGKVKSIARDLGVENLVCVYSHSCGV